MIYWDKQIRASCIEKEKTGYLTACEILSDYDNVTLYLWTDNDMLSIMGDLENFVDEAHYSPKVCEVMAERIGKREGIVTAETYQNELDKLFDYIVNYDYDSLFE